MGKDELRKSLGNIPFIVKEVTGATRAYFSALRFLLLSRLSAGKDFAMRKACAGAASTEQKALELAGVTVKLAKKPQTQVTVASATVSGVALGTAGGAVGLAAGGLAGAAVGVVPAVFTFGLSIPIFALIGGSAGLCLGTVAGGATGAVGGGAVGYGVYGKKTEIYNGASKCASYVKEQKSRV